MKYKCKDCGYKLPESDWQFGENDMQLILKHDKECPKRKRV